MKIAAFYENIVDGAKGRGITTAEALKMLREAGLEQIYLTPDSWKRDEAMLTELLPSLGMSVEGLHYWIMFQEKPDREEYQEAIDLAVRIGAGNVLFVPGLYTSGNTMQDTDRMIRGMQRAVAYGQEKGMPVLMEDFDGLNAPFNCIAGLQYFMEKIPGLGCAIDTGNFIMFQEDELEAAELFADRTVTMHVKDRSREKLLPDDPGAVCADGGKVYPCAVGSGYIRIKDIFDCLKKHGYSGNAVIEIAGCAPEHLLERVEQSVRWMKANLTGR